MFVLRFHLLHLVLLQWDIVVESGWTSGCRNSATWGLTSPVLRELRYWTWELLLVSPFLLRLPSYSFCFVLYPQLVVALAVLWLSPARAITAHRGLTSQRRMQFLHSRRLAIYQRPKSTANAREKAEDREMWMYPVENMHLIVPMSEGTQIIGLFVA